MKPANPLSEYFNSEGQQRALEAYSEFARGNAWSVPMKMDLYQFSHRAFSETRPEDDALKCFKRIYENLASYWQVFRPIKKDRRWDAEKVFNELNQHFGHFSQRTDARLLTFESHDRLRQAMRAMKRLKPGKHYPVMTVSKFLHFFNPRLFPIYDTQIVENRVFRIFDRDYQSFCSERADQCPYKASGLEFYLNYMSWGRALRADAHSDFMNQFARWLVSELPAKHAERLGKLNIQTLDATAFEFTIIGASYAERPDPEKDCSI